MKFLAYSIKLAFCVSVAAFLPRPLPALGQSVQESPPAALQVIATDGAGNEKHLPSIDGVVPMVMVRPNQTVPVTLQFPPDKAGTPVAVAALDGGEISGRGNGTVLPTGRMLLTFRPGAMPGRYRVLVHVPGAEHLLEFYVVDPNNPTFQKRPRGVL